MHAGALSLRFVLQDRERSTTTPVHLRAFDCTVHQRVLCLSTLMAQIAHCTALDAVLLSDDCPVQSDRDRFSFPRVNCWPARPMALSKHAQPRMWLAPLCCAPVVVSSSLTAGPHVRRRHTSHGTFHVCVTWVCAAATQIHLLGSRPAMPDRNSRLLITIQRLLSASVRQLKLRSW